MADIGTFLFSDPISKHLKGVMDYESFRSEVTTANLVNADTPGYRARKVQPDFGKILEEISSPQSMQSNIRMASTNPGHIQQPNVNAQVTEISSVKGKSVSMDNNTVNQDEENRALAESQLQYEAAIQIFRTRGKLVNMAITGNIG
jgi:flagellar basal-body rod protein FlgB